MVIVKILAVDEDWWDRGRLERLLKKALPQAELVAFDNTKAALEFARCNPIGAAFIDMGKSMHTPGYFLAQKILALQRTNIIFTDYEWSHAQEAFALHASGYLRKPLRYEDIVEELQNLRYPLSEAENGRPPPQQSEKEGRGLFSKITNL